MFKFKITDYVLCLNFILVFNSQVSVNTINKRQIKLLKINKYQVCPTLFIFRCNFFSFFFIYFSKRCLRHKNYLIIYKDRKNSGAIVSLCFILRKGFVIICRCMLQDKPSILL